MPWILLLALMVGALCCAGVAVRAQAQEEGKAPVTVKKVSKASNAEIERMLRAVETGPVPELKMGAMCYAPMPMVSKVEYVCPTCGEKTLYVADASHPWTLALGVESLRRAQTAAQEAARLHGVSVALDEKQFCRNCLPGFTNAPQAALVVRLPDGSERRTEAIDVQDLWCLRDFFSGKNVLVGGNDSESPLKGRLPRLRELLGLAQVEE